MRSILESCQPRPDIITGAFNPEIFTANLGQVIDFYRDKPAIIHSLYTDGDQFFRDATYPTENLKVILADVFGRLSGDNALPAIHRLETAFGGGKTHILIALTHLAFRGKDLASAVTNIVSETLLPDPGQIKVVGIPGDELPVHKPAGAALLPYTLWGEIAYQIGGEPLYREVETDATSFAAPGKDYFDKALGGKKVLIMFDELAQYAARLQASRPGGAEMLAAFLMGLHGYARTHSGISVILTLAGQADAFAKETEKLKNLISKVIGHEVEKEEAWDLAQKAEKDLRSVVARDASTIVPIQSFEISRILAKRLFLAIDTAAAEEAADAYMKMYAMHTSELPDRASQADFRDIMAAHYPLHPTFIRFLNEKMATLETFQGTRGVLRILAMVTRSLWSKKIDIPMIHTCHLDLTDSRIVNEILGRTGGGDLLPVLNADVGGPDSATLVLGKSYAQMADQKNPHPLGYPLYEYAWETVFLHSLVGRTAGLNANLFGISEPEAVFAVAFPGVTPPQVKMALNKIEDLEDGALYLRFQNGRYFASLDPSINISLSAIRRSLNQEKVQEFLKEKARKVFTVDQKVFQVAHDVSLPEDIPDNDKSPVLAMIALNAERINAEEFITTKGPNRPRFNQNMVFLLLPQTVREETETWSEDRTRQTEKILQQLEGLAKTVLAMKLLEAQPENYGISRAKLVEAEFKTKLKEKELAPVTVMTQCYDALWFPSASRQIIRREIKSGSGEAGAGVVEEIRRVLVQEGELITTEAATTQEKLLALGKLFFETGETPDLAVLRANFAQQRHWPVLETPGLFDQIIRAGVSRGTWCLFRLETSESTKPEQFFSRDTGDLPFDLDLTQLGWSLLTLSGANQRGWGPKAVDRGQVGRAVNDAIQNGPLPISKVQEEVEKKIGPVGPEVIKEVVKKQIQDGQLGFFHGDPVQQEKPADLTFGRGSLAPDLDSETVVTNPADLARRGWLGEIPKIFTLAGREGAKRLVPLLARIGAFYARGAKSAVNYLDVVDLELPAGGKLRLSLENLSPEGMKQLEELFEVLGGLVKLSNTTVASLEIPDPDDFCPFLKELKKTGRTTH